MPQATANPVRYRGGSVFTFQGRVTAVYIASQNVLYKLPTVSGGSFSQVVSVDALELAYLALGVSNSGTLS